MIKRDTTETIYEYDKEGKLIKKAVTEIHEEEEGTTLTYPAYPYPTNPCAPNTGAPSDDWWRKPYITWTNADPLTSTLTQNISGVINTTTNTATTD